MFEYLTVIFLLSWLSSSWLYEKNNEFLRFTTNFAMLEFKFTLLSAVYGQ